MNCTQPGGHRWRVNVDACDYCGQSFQGLAAGIPGHIERVREQEARERAMLTQGITADDVERASRSGFTLELLDKAQDDTP